MLDSIKRANDSAELAQLREQKRKADSIDNIVVDERALQDSLSAMMNNTTDSLMHAMEQMPKEDSVKEANKRRR